MPDWVVTKIEQLPLANEDMAWSFNASEGNAIIEKYGWSGYKRVHTFVDISDEPTPEKRESYKNPHAKIVDGELKLVWRGVAAAANPNRRPSGVSDEVYASARKHWAAHYRKFGKPIPWEQATPEAEQALWDSEAALVAQDEAHVQEVQDMSPSVAELATKAGEAIGKAEAQLSPAGPVQVLVPPEVVEAVEEQQQAFVSLQQAKDAAEQRALELQEQLDKISKEAQTAAEVIEMAFGILEDVAEGEDLVARCHALVKTHNERELTAQVEAMWAEQSAKYDPDKKTEVLCILRKSILCDVSPEDISLLADCAVKQQSAVTADDARSLVVNEDQELAGDARYYSLAKQALESAGVRRVGDDKYGHLAKLAVGKP